MRLFEFIDINFQNKSYENSVKYDIKRDGELQALHALVNVERRFYKVIGFWKFIFKFFMVRVGLAVEPINFVPKATPTLSKQKAKLEAVPTDPTPAA